MPPEGRDAGLAQALGQALVGIGAWRCTDTESADPATYSSVKLRVTEVSTLTPGPMVEETTTDLT